MQRRNKVINMTCNQMQEYFVLYGIYVASLHFALVLAWISNYIHYKVWDEITYPFLSFNGATVATVVHVITYPYGD